MSGRNRWAGAMGALVAVSLGWRQLATLMYEAGWPVWAVFAVHVPVTWFFTGQVWGWLFALPAGKQREQSEGRN